MKFITFLASAFAIVVAASPAPSPDVSAAEALGATYSEPHAQFCCKQENCRYYDSGCAVSSHTGVRCKILIAL